MDNDDMILDKTYLKIDALRKKAQRTPKKETSSKKGLKPLKGRDDPEYKPFDPSRAIRDEGIEEIKGEIAQKPPKSKTFFKEAYKPTDTYNKEGYEALSDLELVIQLSKVSSALINRAGGWDKRGNQNKTITIKDLIIWSMIQGIIILMIVIAVIIALRFIPA